MQSAMDIRNLTKLSTTTTTASAKVLFFANTEWYLYNFRLALAQELKERGVEVVMVSPPGPYGARLEKAGFRWLALEMRRRALNPVGELRVIRALLRIYRRELPDLVHHFTLKPVIYGSLAARLCGVPAVVNAVAGMGHVFTSDAGLARTLRPLVTLFLRSVVNARSSRLIVQNPDDRRLLVESRLAAQENISLIRGSGVDTERFSPRRALEHRAPRVLLATRLLRDKGVEEFVAAARLLKSAGVDAEFWIAGVPDIGNPSAIGSDEIRTWEAQGIVTALGHVEQMPELLGRVDVVALPSYREGTPKILLEAAASGLPVVATDVPGCREVVDPGVTGLLVPVRDSVALARALRQMIENGSMRARMGVAGRKKMLAEFDQRRVIRETLDVYASLLPLRPIRAVFASRVLLLPLVSGQSARQ
ncbi:MAG TPA: glycosyltransferase family 4 protein [Steroidobacteraceae bacterium]|nr:glycosyltransferase family 4 protein [Steroidobacteraceae bacterium]